VRGGGGLKRWNVGSAVVSVDLVGLWLEKVRDYGQGGDSERNRAEVK